MSAPPDDPRSTVVAEPRWQVNTVWIGFPLVGAAALWALQAGAGWLAALPWVPKQRLFEIVAGWPMLPRTAGALLLGGLIGLLIAGKAADERLRVTVAPERVLLIRGDQKIREFPRKQVVEAYLENGRLVLLGPEEMELAREKHDLEAGPLRAAFVGQGYPWRDQPNS